MRELKLFFFRQPAHDVVGVVKHMQPLPGGVLFGTKAAQTVLHLLCKRAARCGRKNFFNGIGNFANYTAFFDRKLKHRLTARRGVWPVGFSFFLGGRLRGFFFGKAF